ncbi:MAG: hypothetical protein QOC67_4987 [Pseudonocardiales bacterium]|jgi:hypothetical protein|nr:hypothetical protein [Pseudonocardiales bacterium]
MPDDELESYLAAISPEVDNPQSDLTGRFGSAQVFQVRLPALRIEQLRRLAGAQGVPPNSLVVDWVLERLDQEDPGFPSAVPRAPIAPRVHQPGPLTPVNPVEQLNPTGGRTAVNPMIPPRASVGPLSLPVAGPLGPTATATRIPAVSADPALDPRAFDPAPIPAPIPEPKAESGPTDDREPESDSKAESSTGAEPNQVTPIFRAGTELPDPRERRGPRHRAPEPVTSLLTRRKFF